eukprot:12922360-Prorocentrum_lima.AAC.1
MIQDEGIAIADGGATKPIIGTGTWAAWLQKIVELGLGKHVEYKPCRRRFRVGHLEVCMSTRTVTFR